MSPHLERARLLLEQSRYEMAETELRRELSDRPGNSLAHALLAYCSIERDKVAEALEQAKDAIHLGPDVPFCHFVLARAHFEAGKLDLAEQAVNEAIRLDPEEADHFALLASIYFGKRRWSSARVAAERGLRVEPDHVASTNLRALALVQLGKKHSARATVEAALAREPENALTHANMGWTLLRGRDHSGALPHFREALRIDPELEWAREGVVEALKARNIVYRWILQYFFWMSRLSRGAQWGFIIGGVVLVRVLRGILRRNPELDPILWLLGVYFAFVLLTWSADPLFNLLLRLNRYGRLALSREQVVASNWVGGFLLAAALAAAIGLATAATPAFVAAGVCGAMILPVSGTFSAPQGQSRWGLGIYTALLGLIGATAVLLSVATGQVSGVPVVVFLFGWVGFGWVANLILLRA